MSRPHSRWRSPPRTACTRTRPRRRRRARTCPRRTACSAPPQFCWRTCRRRKPRTLPRPCGRCPRCTGRGRTSRRTRGPARTHRCVSRAWDNRRMTQRTRARAYMLHAPQAPAALALGHGAGNSAAPADGVAGAAPQQRSDGRGVASSAHENTPPADTCRYAPGGAASCAVESAPQHLSRASGSATPQLWNAPAASAASGPRAAGGLDCPYLRAGAPVLRKGRRDQGTLTRGAAIEHRIRVHPWGWLIACPQTRHARPHVSSPQQDAEPSSASAHVCRYLRRRAVGSARPL